MSKELKVKTEDISKLLYDVYDVPSGICKYINNALLELKSIKEANPSEALEKFDYIENDIEFAYDDDYVSYDYTDDVVYIKGALIKAQEDEKLKVDICEMFGLDNLFPYNDTKAILKELEEYMGRKNQLWVDFMKTSKELKEQENVLKIIKEKRVDTKLIFTCNSALEYNEYKENRGYNLSDEEFNFLKEKICRMGENYGV